ncbi:MAG: hypothetical protein KatS3mg113_1074 [Planctomycetaceae bacterium]|nr:MAG: hypothetical protein KatS3mg113_1074 [Planctomycetaceae bacterium]
MIASNCTRNQRREHVCWLIVGGLILWSYGASPSCWGADPGVPSDNHEARDWFERHIRPLLQEHCVRCHGGEKQTAGLRLDRAAGLRQGGESGPLVVPGQPEQSLLIQAVRRQGGLAMPPDYSLREQDVQLLETWVARGAPWPEDLTTHPASARHWAFQPMQEAALPPVQHVDWPRTAVDYFILFRLEQSGLSPRQEADRQTLARRIALALTGLRLPFETLQQFVADSDPLAYDKLVEQLLASPHFGEHWARWWLDVARYADTKGYVYAREERFWVHAWCYRDWVIRALNADLPYDRFVQLQVAADLLSSSPEDQAALGFLTLGRRFLGVTHDIIDDRLDVVFRGIMGVTIGCARCHDHKYDPLTLRDYYALYGVFANVTEQRTWLSPAEHAPNDVRGELEQRLQRLEERRAAHRAAGARRMRERFADYLMAQLELHKYPEEGFDQVLEADDMLPAFVRRLRDELARRDALDDSLFMPWRVLRQLPVEEWPANIDSVCASLIAQTETPHTTRFLVQPPPRSLRELAERYQQLVCCVAGDSTTQQAILPDEAERQRWQAFVIGPDAACEIPDEPIVSIEQFFPTAVCEELWKLQGEVDRWLIQQPAAPAVAVGLKDRTHPVNARVFRRGNPALLGAEVPRRWPEAFGGQDGEPFLHGSGRADLAARLVAPDNPLTARVWVNRVWARLFGQGLVTTPSDFGTRADPPSHPELLDWLAIQAQREQWSMKRLIREIVLSATYRQAVHGPPAFPEIDESRSPPATIDPANRRLWRQHRHRLTWEELRDAVTMSVGTLRDDMYGRPFHDWHDRYATRRSVYGLIDRQFLASPLRTFDMANPDWHTPQRAETIVPQQALYLLNHPWILSQSSELAARLEAATDRVEDRVTRLFLSVLQREPTAAERDDALAFLQHAQHTLESLPSPVEEWQYGFASWDAEQRTLHSFQRLPYFDGTAWQGGPRWPDPKLGWVQLTAEGGHAGNDRRHAAVRRWIAPRAMQLAITAVLQHDHAAGDGIHACVVLNEQHVLYDTRVHHQTDRWQTTLQLRTGDRLDFAVDCHDVLNSDDFRWHIAMQSMDESEAGPASTTTLRTRWDSRQDFQGPVHQYASPWTLLVQAILCSNEFMFVD